MISKWLKSCFQSKQPQLVLADIEAITRTDPALGCIDTYKQLIGLVGTIPLHDSSSSPASSDWQSVVPKEESSIRNIKISIAVESCDGYIVALKWRYDYPVNEPLLYLGRMVDGRWHRGDFFDWHGFDRQTVIAWVIAGIMTLR